MANCIECGSPDVLPGDNICAWCYEDLVTDDDDLYADDDESEVLNGKDKCT